MGVMETTKEKASARDEIVKSIRDLVSLKITLPLGNPNLKLVHTNQFLFTELPTETFELLNMGIIAKALNSSYSRYSGYEVNRWYIESVTITNDGNKATMDLELNPFASDLIKYRDSMREYQKTYTDTFKNNTSTPIANTNVKSVASTTNNTLKGGESKLINNLAKKIVGNETDDLKKGKLIHEWLVKNLHYRKYYNSRYNSADACYNNRKALNCADTSRLTASLMRSAGMKCYVVFSNAHDHYFTVFDYKGKSYCSDATSNCRPFNHYWVNGGPACVGRTFHGSGDYSRKCGNNPCS